MPNEFSSSWTVHASVYANTFVSDGIFVHDVSVRETNQNNLSHVMFLIVMQFRPSEIYDRYNEGFGNLGNVE